METTSALGSLPGFFALDVDAVHRGVKRGASVQLDETYFSGQATTLRALQSPVDLQSRIEVVERSAADYERLEIRLDSLARETLLERSRELRVALQQLPEVAYLERHTPGTCFVVPEWSLAGDALHYGARVYVFRADDAPAPEDVVRRNVDAVVDDDRAAFDRYRGELHGYPDCCVEAYLDSDTRSAEWRAVAPLESKLGAVPTTRGDPSASVRDVVPTLFDELYAFYTREFFPEPGCDTAREAGRAVYDALVDAHPAPVVDDYVRLNVAFSYLMARAAAGRASSRPPPGLLGREHRYFYLPLAAVEAIYQTDR